MYLTGTLGNFAEKFSSSQQPLTEFSTKISLGTKECPAFAGLLADRSIEDKKTFFDSMSKFLPERGNLSFIRALFR